MSLRIIRQVTIVPPVTAVGPPATPVEQSLARRLGMAGRLLRTAADAQLAQLGVAAAGLGVLLRLSEDDGLTQAQLARSLRVEAPTMCRMIDRLVRDGLVERRADPADRRATPVSLTPSGRDVAARGAIVIDELEGRAFPDLDDREAAALAAFLDRVIDRLSPAAAS
jgi:MarR family transcriptional regulator, transcriptional regulator for hemolysin